LNLFLGFDEETFKIYQNKIKSYATEKMDILLNDEYFEKNILSDRQKYHPTLNFYLPHELGGCGAPYFESKKYCMFNIYTPEMDLALIKPCWTTKNEFKVDLP